MFSETLCGWAGQFKKVSSRARLVSSLLQSLSILWPVARITKSYFDPSLYRVVKKLALNKVLKFKHTNDSSILEHLLDKVLK